LRAAVLGTDAMGTFVPPLRQSQRAIRRHPDAERLDGNRALYVTSGRECRWGVRGHFTSFVPAWFGVLLPFDVNGAILEDC
jgi:hypothetical protein